jgi:hypothetical protein
MQDKVQHNSLFEHGQSTQRKSCIPRPPVHQAYQTMVSLLRRQEQRGHGITAAAGTVKLQHVPVKGTIHNAEAYCMTAATSSRPVARPMYDVSARSRQHIHGSHRCNLSEVPPL